MGSQLSSDMIRNALGYWYERDVFTARVDVGAGATAGLFPSLTAWNPPSGTQQVVTVESLAVDQNPAIRLAVNYDGRQVTAFGAGFPPGLRPARVSAMAANNLSAALTNVGPVMAPNTQVNYGVSIWRAPIAEKVVHGWNLTNEDLTRAQEVGLTTNPVQERGTFPIPIPAVIERTYENRMIQSPLAFPGPMPTATTAGAVFAQVNAQPPGQDLLVLRSLGAEADADYGITITLDRDNQLGQSVWDASQLSMDDPLDLFIPANTSLNFHIQAAVTPPGPTPVRFEVWHVSLSSILRVRMGLSSMADLAGLYGQVNGDRLYNQVLAGVR